MNKTKTYKVGIILVNWQTPIDTEACLRSLTKLKYGNYFIVVVDNGSADDSVPYLRSKFPNLQIIEQPINLGFAGGNNIGIKSAMEQNADAVWLLNTDTIVAPDTLSHMVNALSDGVGIVGSRLYFYQDDNGKTGFDSQKLQFDGGKIYWGSGETHSYHIRGPQKSESNIVNSDYAHGASMLITSKAIEKVGLLPEFYFLNYEETDFCCQVVKSGYSIKVSRQAKVWHKVGSSMGSLSVAYFYYMHRNVWYFMIRHASLLWKLWFIPRYVLTMAKGFVVWCMRRQSQPKTVFIKAFIDAVFWRTGKANL